MLYLLAEVFLGSKDTLSSSFREHTSTFATPYHLLSFSLEMQSIFFFFVKLTKFYLQSFYIWQKMQKKKKWGPSKGMLYLVAFFLLLFSVVKKKKVKLPFSLFFFSQTSILLHVFYIDSFHPKFIESSLVSVYHQLFAGILGNKRHGVNILFFLFFSLSKWTVNCYPTPYA